MMKNRHVTSLYPSLKWVKSQLRNKLVSHCGKPILNAYIIGSEAKGTATADSDLDIAVIITPVRGKTSLKYSEIYHSKFHSDALKPKWNNRIVDFQFFYPADNDIQTHNKIQLI